jgi:BASS family bile acid:Na+ symporter
VLATRHFADPITALPSAISATMHSLIGSLLAAHWRRDAR